MLSLVLTNGLLIDLLPYTHRMFSSIDRWLMLRRVFPGNKAKRDARLLDQLAHKLSRIENTPKLRLLLQHLEQLSRFPMASTISMPFLRPLPLPRLTSMHRLNRQISSHPCLRTQGLASPNPCSIYKNLPLTISQPPMPHYIPLPPLLHRRPPRLKA